MKSIPFLLLFFFAGMVAYAQREKRIIVLAEQSQNRIALADVDAHKIVWEWKPGESNVNPEHVKWFNAPDDAKPAYNNNYLLITASGGGVALIRIADKKTVFYAYAGGNPHSAELLPDGNIVTASSTGNFLTLFKVDSNKIGEDVPKTVIPVAFGHNVVWDKKHQLLWTAAMDHVKSYVYNFDCGVPALKMVDSVHIPGTEAHDLFPDDATSTLWLTDPTNVYRFDVDTKKVIPTDVPQKNIKSVSSGPHGFPTIICLPKEKWWTDEVLDIDRNSVFQQKGLKIYKARWMVGNNFSYENGAAYRQCP